MSFDPQSTIYLCNVPFDSTYKNVVYFNTKVEQMEYFAGKTVKTYNDYLIVRETLPDGGMRSSIKVGENIAVLRAMLANYMYWINPNHSNKYFYAFITDFIYVNERTTKIVFETDVYQTWLFEANLLQSFVIREHAVSDGWGWNLTPEKFNIQDYTYELVDNEKLLQNWGYLIASSAPHLKEAEGVYRGRLHSGIYQGLYFYFSESVNEVNNIIDSIEEVKSDSVLSITLIPKFCIGNSFLDFEGFNYVNSTSAPASKTVTITLNDEAFSFGGYIPKNKKLFHAPFFKLMVSNHNGQQAEYALEDFTTGSETEHKYQFRLYGDICANPSVTLIPLNYKKTGEIYDFGISISGFPQCSFNSDSFKLWLAKNSQSLMNQVGADASMILAGIGMTAGLAFGGAGIVAAGTGAIAGAAETAAVYGGQALMSKGVMDILKLGGTVYAQSKEPNKATVGACTNNLLTAIGQNDFSFHLQKIKQHHAIMIDDFFTLYGYQTNTLKVPNRNVRRYFTFTQTVDVNIAGGIPNDDMIKLKSIYNNGVTQWAKDAVIGDYSVDNYCLSEGGLG